ncbi:MAG: tRNA (adenosine(37)-N6)-threonylcarbamoyltransferase complex ATPase subunit type 1 TsaE [Chthoniobacterales bacterium]|jgi:tRNA threonylcarbamoyladenosine biosynthesis protein TsaE
MTKLHSERPEQTVAAGRALAARLGPGCTVALRGDLGAGKTHFVRGLLGGWEAEAQATSPTFALLHEYPTPRGTVFHLDLYRAGSAEEVWSAAHDELEDSGGMVVIEWADRFPELVPPHAVHVFIAHAGDGCRTIEITE